VGKKNTSTVENRVYLFKDLGAAFLAEHGAGLLGTEAQRAKVLQALGDIAHAACVVADHGDVEGRRIGDMVAQGHQRAAKRSPERAPKKSPKKAPKKTPKKTPKAERKKR
jgi:hypothetical protein